MDRWLAEQKDAATDRVEDSQTPYPPSTMAQSLVDRIGPQALSVEQSGISLHEKEQQLELFATSVITGRIPAQGSDLRGNGTPVQAGPDGTLPENGELRGRLPAKLGRLQVLRNTVAEILARDLKIGFIGETIKNNPLFPALRSGHWLFQRPSPQKAIS
jgi:hypothetical protein